MCPPNYVTLFHPRCWCVCLGQISILQRRKTTGLPFTLLSRIITHTWSGEQGKELGGVEEGRKGGWRGTEGQHLPNANCTHHKHKYTHAHSMLVCRGADADPEDKNKQVPSFLAQRCQAFECRQIILQYLKDRAELLAKQAKEVGKGGMEGWEGGGKKGRKGERHCQREREGVKWEGGWEEGKRGKE